MSTTLTHPHSHPGLVRNDAGAGAPPVMIDRDRRRAELLRLSNKAHVEHMAVLLAFARPTVDLNHVDAPIIFLTTMLADHDIRFVDIHLAVTRAFELRRDVGDTAIGAPHASIEAAGPNSDPLPPSDRALGPAAEESGQDPGSRAGAGARATRPSRSAGILPALVREAAP